MIVGDHYYKHRRRTHGNCFHSLQRLWIYIRSNREKETSSSSYIRYRKSVSIERAKIKDHIVLIQYLWEMPWNLTWNHLKLSIANSRIIVNFINSIAGCWSFNRFTQHSIEYHRAKQHGHYLQPPKGPQVVRQGVRWCLITGKLERMFTLYSGFLQHCNVWSLLITLGSCRRVISSCRLVLLGSCYALCS